MGRTSQIAPTRAELINMGLLYTPEHGYAAFTVPHFDRFILRAIPELVVPEFDAVLGGLIRGGPGSWSPWWDRRGRSVPEGQPAPQLRGACRAPPRSTRCWMP